MTMIASITIGLVLSLESQFGLIDYNVGPI
jgi:hypothetical protein